MGTTLLRIANLPPEIPNDVLRQALAKSGKILDIRTASWSKTYRYVVSNGIRLVTFLLTQHAPSHLIVVGYRVLITYDGIPATCYGCGTAGHMYQDCPARQGTNRQPGKARLVPYAAALTMPAPSMESRRLYRQWTNRRRNREKRLTYRV